MHSIIQGSDYLSEKIVSDWQVKMVLTYSKVSCITVDNSRQLLRERRIARMTPVE